MMTETTTPYGTLRTGSLETIFERLAATLTETAGQRGDPFTVGLTGGSTPKAFYAWALEHSAIEASVRAGAVWSVSDERMVALDDNESNFGTADRQFLEPLRIPPEFKFPWPVTVDPHSAARAFDMRFHERFGEGRAFDLCLLGMGDDGHTASIFPGSPLLAIDSPGTHFSSVDVPGKGWRLSITPQGLADCGRIVVMVTGEGKAERLAAVMREPQGSYPIQILAEVAERAEWLVDDAAGALL